MLYARRKTRDRRVRIHRDFRRESGGLLTPRFVMDAHDGAAIAQGLPDALDGIVEIRNGRIRLGEVE